MRRFDRTFGLGLGLALVLAIVVAIGVIDTASGNAGMASDYQFTSSADGRTIYMWRVDGEELVFIDSARAREGGQRGGQRRDDDRDDDDDDDIDEDDDDDGDGKGRGQGQGKGRGKGGGGRGSDDFQP